MVNSAYGDWVSFDGVPYTEAAKGYDTPNIEIEKAKDYILMQWTGLKDKNGKDVFEGDVCRVLYTDWGSKDANDQRSIEQYIRDISKVASVEFADNEWQFNFGLDRYGDINYGTFHVGAHGFIEVIGNIYEHSDLLK